MPWIAACVWTCAAWPASARSGSSSPRSPYELETMSALWPSTRSLSAVEEVGVVAALGADEVDVGAGGHGVHGLDVERLLAVPARRVALAGAAS